MFDEIHLIREWIGAAPLDAPLYSLWGHAVKWLSLLGGDILATASTLSILSFALNAILIFFAARNLFTLPVKIAERRATFDEVNYQGFEYIAAATLTLLYLATPGFNVAAYEPTPLLFSQMFPALIFFTISELVIVKRFSSFVGGVLLVGVFSAAAFLSAGIGWLPMPLIMIAVLSPFVRRGVLVMPTLGIFLCGFVFSLSLLSYCCFANPLNDLIRVTALTAHSLPGSLNYPGAMAFFFLGIVPFFAGAILLGTGRVKPIVLRLTFFLGWGLVAVAMLVTAVVMAIVGSDLANKQFAEGILSSLDGRDVIVSDGKFDDYLSFRIPEGATIVTLDENKTVPNELLKSVKDENALFAADLGSKAFVSEWLKSDLSACSRVIVVSTAELPVVTGGRLVPNGWCWRVMREKDVPSAEELRKRWETSWGEISSKLSDRNASTWYMRRLFAVQAMHIVRLLRAEGHEKSAEALFSYLVGHVDSSFSREAEQRRQIDRERVIACVKKLGELDSLSADERSSRLIELEDSILPELERTIGEEAAWLVHVYRGEIALKKGKAYHMEARDEYRAATHDERSDLNATAGKLLLLDASLKDDEGTKSDALSILRRDRANKMALAIWGNQLATLGENEKAEQYLRRATEGDGPVMLEPLNDLAEVLSRQGKLEEALEISDRVIEHASENWTFIETRAAIQMRLGNLWEASETLDKAVHLANEAHQSDIARNILDIDRARLMHLNGSKGPEFRHFLRNLMSRKLTPAHRRLVEEIANEGD